MRIAVISHTYVLEANRGKLEALARLPGVEVLAITPRTWRNRDIGQRLSAEAHRDGTLVVRPLSTWSLGFASLTAYAPEGLWRLLRRFRPDLVHLEEEPWSLAALEVSLVCEAMGVPLTLFTWENTARRLPFPLRLIRRWVFHRALGCVVGNAEAKALAGRLGFSRALIVLPQLGVDASACRAVQRPEPPTKVVGYVGRLVPQKGLAVLMEAVARLPGDIRLMLVGAGPFKNEMLRKTRALSLDGRVDFHEGATHDEVPRYLREMTVLVLPSLSTATWKEQFGHVLIEAMACGVPVIGSTSGAIPEVIADAGLVVTEGNVELLAAALDRALSTPALRADLGDRGRSRVIAEYTNDVVATRLAAFFRSVVRGA